MLSNAAFSSVFFCSAVTLLNKQSPSSIVVYYLYRIRIVLDTFEHYHRKVLSDTKQTTASKHFSVLHGVYEGNFYILLVKVSYQLPLWEELYVTGLLNL